MRRQVAVLGVAVVDEMASHRSIAWTAGLRARWQRADEPTVGQLASYWAVYTALRCTYGKRPEQLGGHQLADVGLHREGAHRMLLACCLALHESLQPAARPRLWAEASRAARCVGHGRDALYLLYRRAQAVCAAHPSCAGLTFRKPAGVSSCEQAASAPGNVTAYLKLESTGNGDAAWCTIVEPPKLVGVFVANVETVYTKELTQS